MFCQFNCTKSDNFLWVTIIYFPKRLLTFVSHNVLYSYEVIFRFIWSFSESRGVWLDLIGMNTNPDEPNLHHFRVGKSIIMYLQTYCTYLNQYVKAQLRYKFSLKLIHTPKSFVWIGRILVFSWRLDFSSLVFLLDLLLPPKILVIIITTRGRMFNLTNLLLCL